MFIVGEAIFTADMFAPILAGFKENLPILLGVGVAAMVGPVIADFGIKKVRGWLKKA